MSSDNFKVYYNNLMAARQDELVLSVVIPHLQQASKRVRRSFVENYERLLFPRLGTLTSHIPWKTF